MNLVKVSGIFVFILFIAMSTSVVFAQDVIVLNSNDGPPVPILESSADMEGNMQWVWGEVTGLDAGASTFTLKYLDYENDQEKELALVVDENTVYENVKDFNEVKVQDTLSIDYKVGPDGKNLAKNVSFEKPDIFSADAQDSAAGNVQLSAPVQTAAPIMEEPIAQPEIVAPVMEEPIAQPEIVAPEVAPAVTQQAQ